MGIAAGAGAGAAFRVRGGSFKVDGLIHYARCPGESNIL